MAALLVITPTYLNRLNREIPVTLGHQGLKCHFNFLIYDFLCEVIFSLFLLKNNSFYLVLKLIIIIL